MVHTYDDSLYSRRENMPMVGFEQMVFQEDFPEGSHEAGGFLSDHSLTQELIRRFEDRGDGPIFLYGLSMENHPPYHVGKFWGDTSNLGMECGVLNQWGLEVMDSLAYGLRDADVALGELTILPGRQIRSSSCFWETICQGSMSPRRIPSIPLWVTVPAATPRIGARRR